MKPIPLDLSNASPWIKAAWPPILAQARKQKAKGKGADLKSRIAGGMNKLELRYADHLARRQIAKEIYAYEWVGKNKNRSFALGKRRKYTPDFYVWITPDVLEIHETKGFLRDGGSIRFDLAAEANPDLVFRMVRWTKQGWDETRVRNKETACANSR